MNKNEECLLLFLKNPGRLDKSIEILQAYSKINSDKTDSTATSGRKLADVPGGLSLFQ